MNDLSFTQIELKHIQLELESGRGQHLRHFVDQYFCYKNGYVKKTGRADWEAIVWRENVSRAASRTTIRTDVVKEHVIPMKRIRKDLLALSDTTIDSIEKYLDEHLILSTITKEEDSLLRMNKLTSSMPPEYDNPSHRLFRDKFARYKVAGIKL